MNALDGVRVLDLTTIIAGPVCGRTLAAYGADVIKIDRPGPERPLWFPHLHIDANRGKRHVLIDIASPTGKADFLRLVEGADVLIENSRRGVMDRLGVGYDALAHVRPTLIYGAVRMYPSGDERSPWPGYETTAQAVTGLATRFAQDGVPRRAGGGAINDYAAGMTLAFRVLMALRAQPRGAFIETSLTTAAENYQAFPLTGTSEGWPARDDETLRSELEAKGTYMYRDQPAWGRVGHVGYPVRFDPPLVQPWQDAPAWGEHTGEVLQPAATAEQEEES